MEEKKEWIRDNGVLVARWTLVTIWHTLWHRQNVDKARFKYGPKENLILPLNENECSEGESVPKDTLRYNWRQETLLGGSGNHTEQYTFADICK